MADEAPAPPAETVESIAALYLGNILYSLERCAGSLEGEGKPVDAGFYRAIARKLAEARGKENRRGPRVPDISRRSTVEG